MVGSIIIRGSERVTSGEMYSVTVTLVSMQL